VKRSQVLFRNHALLAGLAADGPSDVSPADGQDEADGAGSNSLSLWVSDRGLTAAPEAWARQVNRRR
jgi:hypothetical protein